MLVHKLALSTLGRGLVQDESDLEVLQALLDSGALTRDRTYELQSISIVLGFRLLSALEGLEWAMVEDEYGRDPALRYSRHVDPSVPTDDDLEVRRGGHRGRRRGPFRTICDGFRDVREPVT